MAAFFFQFEDLDGIIELTNNRDVLLDLVKLRPKGVGVLEHNIGQFFRLFYSVDQQLKSAEYQANLQKMFSDFLIQQSDAAIVVINCPNHHCVPADCHRRSAASLAVSLLTWVQG